MTVRKQRNEQEYSIYLECQAKANRWTKIILNIITIAQTVFCTAMVWCVLMFGLAMLDIMLNLSSDVRTVFMWDISIISAVISYVLFNKDIKGFKNRNFHRINRKLAYGFMKNRLGKTKKEGNDDVKQGNK